MSNINASALNDPQFLAEAREEAYEKTRELYNNINAAYMWQHSPHSWQMMSKSSLQLTLVMTDYNNSTLEFSQSCGQTIQGLQVTMITWFIQKKNVRLFCQDSTEAESHAFSTAQGANWTIRVLSSKAKGTQILANIPCCTLCDVRAC
mmetsp:Transcript_3437/g.8950  ORF Transcript_3437/g.8950 Transcript_3437/m.8950 type:complete len:148 (-) Transcript_3437:2310-2753(-)